jgi:hypothetical protein
MAMKVLALIAGNFLHWLLLTAAQYGIAKVHYMSETDEYF